MNGPGHRSGGGAVRGEHRAGTSARAENLRVEDRVVPPGYRAFPVLGGLLGAIVGLTAGILTGLSVADAVGIWVGTGLAYGLALWLAAHHGYLPFPEPE